MPRKFQFLLAGIVLGAALLVAGFMLFNKPGLHGTVLTPPKAMDDVALVGGNGPASLSSLKGKVVVLFFGYTNCPDECPTTLAKLKTVVDALGSSGSQVQVVMVTVDPERDSPVKVTSYVHEFHPSFIGLTGSSDQIAAAAKEFGIAYQKTNIKSDTVYSMEHTLAEFVFDKKGQLRTVWPYEIVTGDALSDLSVLVSEK